MIPFNKPFIAGNELDFIQDAVNSGKISGNGKYTKLCQSFFESRYGFKKTLMTTSCTDALEMTAILLDIGPGDEVIMPSYTFVSTANAFCLRGATIKFADCAPDIPNIRAEDIEPLISKKTKAVVVVHYAGLACDMDPILDLCGQYAIPVIEDAAQAIDSFYKGRPLGSLGNFGTLSFHETKNIISGEGGMLIINDEKYVDRAEIIWEKGTNRAAFFRGEVNKYGWVDVGSSFLPSELVTAFLYAQLEAIEQIQKKRVELYHNYQTKLSGLFEKNLTDTIRVPDYATVNGHLFALVAQTLDERTELLSWLNNNGIYAVFHYLALHNSDFFHTRHDGRPLPNTERFADCLLRLPLYYEMTGEQQEKVIDKILEFFFKG